MWFATAVAPIVWGAVFLFAQPAAAEVTLLSPADARAYNSAFEAADRGDWKTAFQAMKSVEDGVLRSHVEARALLKGRPRTDALSSWMGLNRSLCAILRSMLCETTMS